MTKTGIGPRKDMENESRKHAGHSFSNSEAMPATICAIRKYRRSHFSDMDDQQ